jgi:outer membrane protein OmpA-like peptidoglycan-associated protein
MTLHHKPIIALAVMLLSACAYIPPNETTASDVSQDYSASGFVGDVRAYAYGNHTIIEFDKAEPALVLIRDQNGETVDFEKVGRFYRLNRHLDSFTLWVNGSSTTFTATSKTRVFTAQVKNPEQLEAESFKVELDNSNALALLKLSETQLEELRQTLSTATKNRRATAEEISLINARLDEIETRVTSAAAALIRVSFPTGSTQFKPSKHIELQIIESAKDAEIINIRGYTDSRIPGPADPKISLGRALAAKNFFVNKGIEDSKIKVSSVPAGDFLAPNNFSKGRALNRRVEIEFIDSRISQLKERTEQLAKN